MKATAALSLLAGACLMATSAADAQEKTSPWRLHLGCAIQSSKATVTNTQSARIAAGTRVSLKYTQRRIGDFGIPYYVSVTGEYSLSGALAPGQAMQLSLSNPSGPLCGAWFDPGPPDLRLEQVTRGNAVVDVVVRNGNDFFDAPPSVLKVAYMKCTQIQLAQWMAWMSGVPKGSARSVRVSRAFPPGFQYLVVVADATNQIHEANESNNVYTEVGLCLH